MREELIRVLNYKLNDINSDIEALENLNNKIDEEKEKSAFIQKILNIFNEGDNSLLNFAKIEKDDFERILDLVGEDVRNTFSSDSCNYDGLVYLINGIKSGVSLTLTSEQTHGIEELIRVIKASKKEFDSAVDGYVLVKSRYEINDIGELNEKKDNYLRVIDSFGSDEYIKDTDILTEAIEFSSVSPQETIDLLTYVLEYNASIYEEGKHNYHEEKDNEVKEEIEETKDTHENYFEEENYPEYNYQDEMSYEDNYNDNNEFHFNDLNDDMFTLPNVTFDEEEHEEEKENDNDEDSEIVPDTSEYEEEEYQEYRPYIENDKEEGVNEEEEENDVSSELAYVPLEDEEVVESPIEDNVSLNNFDEIAEDNDSFDSDKEMVEDTLEITEKIPQEESEEETINDVDNDFNDIVTSNEDYEEPEEGASTRELQKIFNKYGIEENTILNELVGGNIDVYQNTLDLLNESSLLESFIANRELLVETLLYSNSEVINDVLRIVRDDLSVDEEDYGITVRIVINTIPSVFVKEGGNYDNFVKNVELFKELGINLINLFDFSKEVFVADNDSIKNNIDVVNKYGYDITYKNAKYLLLIPNIGDKLDYYVESVYEDKEKNQTFDGVEYIKDYAAKLNVVTGETIKRLRYASENGKKVFGSKPGSLSGEITNLKVNALDISSDYMNKFFDNEFANLTGEEIREYIKLIHNSSNVGNYSDELDILNSYRDGLRYNMDGVNVSYNKVLRNYSILRSYGIDTKKALQFAVCYNLIITKDEYDKLNNLLDKIGGNE